MTGDGSSALDVLAAARYVLLVTYRRSGAPVPTPVWCARSGDELWVWSNPAAGKIKRIRGNPAVLVAPCSMRGDPRGPGLPMVARRLPDDEVPGVLGVLARKYGLIGWLTLAPNLVGARIGRPRPAAAIALTMPAAGSPEPPSAPARERSADPGPE